MKINKYKCTKCGEIIYSENLFENGIHHAIRNNCRSGLVKIVDTMEIPDEILEQMFEQKNIGAGYKELME